LYFARVGVIVFLIATLLSVERNSPLYVISRVSLFCATILWLKIEFRKEVKTQGPDKPVYPDRPVYTIIGVIIIILFIAFILVGAILKILIK
jgi:amino acid permease